MKPNDVRVESWKTGKQYIVRNEKGAIISRKPVKGAKLTLSSAREVFRQKGTFIPGVRVQKTRLSRVTEIVRLQATTEGHRPMPRPKGVGGVTHQYVVQGVYKGNLIAGRSFSQLHVPQTDARAREMAWENFVAALGRTGNISDYDEGLRHLDDVTDIEEGWIVYR